MNKQNFKNLTSCFMAVLLGLTFYAASSASALENCDYDEVAIGYGSVSVENGNYTLSFEVGDGYSYEYKGSTQDKLFKDIQKTFQTAQKNEMGGQNIALFKSLDSPVCASDYTEEILYVQPGTITKDKYSVIGVCIPETSDCWKLKINANHPQFNTFIKEGKSIHEGKTWRVYSAGKDVLEIYPYEEDYEEDYSNYEAKAEYVYADSNAAGSAELQYTEQGRFLLSVNLAASDIRWTCDYQGLCEIMNGDFVCGNADGSNINGRISQGVLEIISASNQSYFCGLNGNIQGRYVAQ